MTRTLWTYAQETRGNFATVGAVCLTVLLLGAGSALDFGRAANVRQNIQAAGDTGALAAAAAFQQDTSLSKGQLEKIAKDAAEANCANVECGEKVKAKANVSATEIVVTMTSDSDNAVMSIFGSPHLDVSSTSVSGLGGTTGAFTSVYIIADVSGSMNIPDSPAEITQLMDNYKPWGSGCAFACHVPAEPHQDSGLSVARGLGLYLREDRVKDEITAFGTSLLDDGDGKVTLNLITYMWDIKSRSLGLRSAWDLQHAMTSYPATSDATQSWRTFSMIASEIPQSGSGATVDDPVVVGILVTDGVEQLAHLSDDSKPIDPADCDLLKAKVDTLYVVNVVYPHPDTTDPGSHDRTTQIRTFYDQLKPNLQACASSSADYFEGLHGSDIATAFSGLTAQIGDETITTARLVR